MWVGFKMSNFICVGLIIHVMISRSWEESDKAIGASFPYNYVIENLVNSFLAMKISVVQQVVLADKNTVSYKLSLGKRCKNVHKIGHNFTSATSDLLLFQLSHLIN